MKRKPTTLLSTTVAVFVGLNMQVRRDSRAELLTLPILHLTPLLIWTWRLGRLLARLDRGTAWLLHRLNHLSYAVDITTTLVAIGLRSMLYGLGVLL